MGSFIMNTENSIITLSIPTYRMNKVLKVINRINNLKCNDQVILSASITGKEIKKFEIPVRDMDGCVIPLGQGHILMETIYVEHTNIEVINNLGNIGIIGYKDWEILGRLEADYNFEFPLIKENYNSNHTIPYIHSHIQVKDMVCEHCNKKISTRYKYYSLYNHTNNSYKLVGNTCLAEFIGIDISNYLSYFESILMESRRNDDYDDLISSGDYYISITDALLLGIELINQDGQYISVEKADIDHKSTAHRIRDMIGTYEAYEIIDQWYIDGILDPHIENIINEIKNWALSLQPNNGYVMNNQQFITADKVPAKFIGYVVSLLPQWYKHKESIIHKPESQYIGNIKDKITLEVTIKKILEFNSIYGINYIIIMEDKNNNILKWSTSKCLEYKVNDIITIMGTIKSHDIYNNIKQTSITRCKIL